MLLESLPPRARPQPPGQPGACPYKAGEYAAGGLPMISCLGGELGDLLNHWEAGSSYNEGDVDSLYAAFEKYSTDPDLLELQSFNARHMAEALFDRTISYKKLTEFTLD